VTGLLESNSDKVPNASDPDQWFPTSSIQQENCKETANGVAARDGRIPSALPPGGDEISPGSRRKGNSVLNLEGALQLARSVRSPYNSQHLESCGTVKPKHNGANRAVKSPECEAPLRPQNFPLVLGTNLRVVESFRHWYFRTN